MNGIMVHWTDLKNLIYLNIMFKWNLKKFIAQYIFKNKKIILILNIYNYYNFFKYIKYNNIIRVTSLLDLIVVQNMGNLKEFELTYVCLSYLLNIRFFFKYFIKKEDLIISLNKIFWSSTWLEREVWDLFGIKFILHIDLRRILTDYGFMGHPLLKSFPLIGFFELRFDDLHYNIIKEFIELIQDFRLYNWKNSWYSWIQLKK